MSIDQSANFLKANLSLCRRENRGIKSSMANVLRLWLFSNASTHVNDCGVGPQSARVWQILVRSESSPGSSKLSASDRGGGSAMAM